MATINALLPVILFASLSSTASSVMLTHYREPGCTNVSATIDFSAAQNVVSSENCSDNYTGTAVMCDGKCLNLPSGSQQSAKYTCAQNNKGTLFLYSGQRCLGTIQAFIFEDMGAMADLEAARCSNITIADGQGTLAYLKFATTGIKLPNCTSEVNTAAISTTTGPPRQGQLSAAHEASRISFTVLVLAVASAVVVHFGER